MKIDTRLLRDKFKISFLIGALSFLVPFAAVLAYACLVAGWNLKASLIAGTALSATSLAVVYSVLVETWLAPNPQQAPLRLCFI